MYWMGIDIGSISTDLVLLNDKNEINLKFVDSYIQKSEN